MNSSSACVEAIRRDVPLAGQTWFGLGGSARYWASPTSRGQLAGVLRWAVEQSIAVRVLGRGANVLVRDRGFDGLVIRLDQPAFCAVRYRGQDVHAGGGANLMHLARDCVRRGLGGIECLAGIPATIGGAVTMNAGGRYGQISDVVESVELMERDGSVHEVGAADLGFGYRRSSVADRVVLGVRFRLSRCSTDDVVGRFHAYWREKSESQPLADHCAGCMFKNPPGMSAGKLIDDSGLKGMHVGRARVSQRHANFIVADRGASADDVLELVRLVRDRVRRRAGVLLELEIDVW